MWSTHSQMLTAICLDLSHYLHDGKRKLDDVVIVELATLFSQGCQFSRKYAASLKSKIEDRSSYLTG